MSDFDPFDPVNTVMRSLHKSNMLAAKDVQIAELEAENARLKAEVERLTEGNECLNAFHDKEMERSAYLLEEFNRTTAWGRGLESDLSHARVEISFLKAEVERLSAADSYLQSANEHSFEQRCDELEAEIERLTGVIKEVVKEAQENSDRFVRRLNEEAAHPACVAMNRKLGDANNEIHHLKAEVERLTSNTDKLCKHGDLEIERLKAEVKRLRYDAFRYIAELAEQSAEIADLKAEFARLESVDENELGLTVPRRLVLFWMYRAKRLVKAGDAMSEVIQTIDHERFECYPKYRMTTKERNACDAWLAAKEGKQP